MQLRELLSVLEEIAPTRNAEAWDNVGLLVGDPRRGVSKAMLTIDYTAAGRGEAAREGCDAVVAYHPPIFEAIKRVTAAASLVFDAIRRGVAIYSPHTALDVAEGGTNDMLADAIGLDAADRMPLRLVEPKATQYKLVTFVPAEGRWSASATRCSTPGRAGSASTRVQLPLAGHRDVLRRGGDEPDRRARAGSWSRRQEVRAGDGRADRTI